MKSQLLFPGLLFISLGIYCLGHTLDFDWLTPFSSPPMLLVLIGSSFLLSASLGRQPFYFAPGAILVGIGIYFMLSSLLPSNFLSSYWILFLIIGIAFFILFFTNKKGLVLAILFTAIAGFLAFAPKQWVPELPFTYWPVLLILVGSTMLIKKH
ncbi:hypothetical protein [Aureibacillus halotolerans]|uniref:DUF5668 domain-containing protein n=1 Tax=Aureibacillus halotolerans TaxID=1508390 RepID=A0A4R6TWS9_9BACI|nr:hypothetical protein [Aureibacillus halotolerans]TDQ37941.1 hypothetical protein EV213_11119 [Aureibacillus halotolerans]